MEIKNLSQLKKEHNMKYEVWKSDEIGHDYKEATFTDTFEATDYMNLMEYYNPGWHYRYIEVKG